MIKSLWIKIRRCNLNPESFMKTRIKKLLRPALIAGLGTASGCIAVAVLALYPVVEAFGARRWPVWVLSVALLLWTGHLWLMAQRGRIHDDPVSFALRDPVSRGVGLLTLALLLLAA